MKLPLLSLLGVFYCLGVQGQNLVSNASFEFPSGSDTNRPAGWTAVGTSFWESFGRTGGRAVSLSNAIFSNPRWSSSVPVQQGKAYVVRFWTASSNMNRGFLVAGFNTATRDFLDRPGHRWMDYSYVAWIPSNGAPDLRLGSWDGDGKLYFDDVEVLPLDPVHKLVGGYRLGAGESLSAGRYEFQSQNGSYGGNFSRPLAGANCSYNTTRWLIEPGKRVTYRHHLAGQTFSNAQVTCSINNFNNITSTSLWVEASSDGVNWQHVGGLIGTNQATFAVPSSLQPASELFVRLGSAATPAFWLTDYRFASDVSDAVTQGTGETHYWGRWLTPTNMWVDEVSSTVEGKLARLLLSNAAPTNQTYQLTARAEFDGTVRERIVVVEVPAGVTNSASVLLPTAGFGDNIITLQVHDGAGILRLHQSMRHSVSILADDSYGELLPSPPGCPGWWCAGPYKVGETRVVPLQTNVMARVSAARNEHEPFQFVLRPAAPLTNVVVGISDFTGLTNGGVIASTNVTICRAEYVNVGIVLPTERFSVGGNHTDPLVPVTAPLTLGAGTNCPLWFTVYVPKDAPAGEYEATVAVNYDGGGFTVPVRLRVFGFALTDVTHTRTTYGAVLPYDWHMPTNAVQERAIWELYLQNFARHRISPFLPQMYAPVQWAYHAADQSFTHNFTEFTTAMERFLEEYHFTAFKDINYERELPPIAGVPRFNANNTAINTAYRPLYTKLMRPYAQHLRERGWIDRVYSFWLDEPKDPQYPLVRDGMLMIEEMAPDWGRFQSEFNGPTPSLNATIWLPQWPLSSAGMAEGVRRQAAGEEFWFYFATNPKAPAPNNFVDHPAINPRIRSWYGEKFNFDGEAYYGVNYYLGTPNPWIEPMSYSEYPGGAIYYWGNGDGTLIYPPVKTKPATPVIAGPLDSIRWEMIRDGMEDREYFWLLRRVLALAETQLGTNHPAVVEAHAARSAALEPLPMPHVYPYEPARLLAARQRLAEAIEALDNGAPFIAKEPLSKVVSLGGNERLRVEAVGWPVPDIQWQHQGTNLPGAVGPRLSLTNITVDMAGEYCAIASNTHGAVTSAVGRLTVLITNQPPVVIQDPESLTRTNGGRAVFGVGVSSLTPIAYQWLWDGNLIAGATNVTLVLASVSFSSAGFYSVMASNSFGAVTSAPAVLTLAAPEGSVPPAISSHPTNLTIFAGQPAQLQVVATGTPPFSYQWFFNTNLPVAGGTGSILTLTNVQPSQAGAYHVVVGNVAGVVTSAVVTLTVQLVAPLITSQPTNLTVIQGQNAQFTVAVSGSVPLSYQWFFNETNALTGATAGILSLSNVQPALVGAYTVRVTNVVGAITSAPALLQLQGMPNYTMEPPTFAGERQGGGLVLTLAPDNRLRSVLVSSNLVDWDEFYSAGPSAAQELVLISTTNSPARFFRVLVVP